MDPSKSFWTKKAKDWVRDLTSLGNPLILLFVPFCFFGYSKTWLFLLISLGINEIFCSLIKMVFHKKRPDGQQFKGAIQKLDAGSFPSIHTSRIAAAYLPMVVFTESLLTRIIVLLFLILVAVSRILLKRHFPADVIGGLFIGAAIFLGFYFFVY